ncbi:hypothetical protein GCM10023205_70510 [Yinghuangia aomiensis]|uniref:HTH cro/C1-type domain-containing protein n=1 Tax=Yinghuangia aomiensis TaxID=676205 RepID=A0ABP9I5T9_9ACTN
MVRTPLTEEQRYRGRALGQTLREARGARSAAQIAAESGVPLDTLRKIERGAIAMPAFFTVAQLARVLDLDLATLADDMLAAGHADHAVAS